MPRTQNALFQAVSGHMVTGHVIGSGHGISMGHHSTSGVGHSSTGRIVIMQGVHEKDEMDSQAEERAANFQLEDWT